MSSKAKRLGDRHMPVPVLSPHMPSTKRDRGVQRGEFARPFNDLAGRMSGIGI